MYYCTGYGATSNIRECEICPHGFVTLYPNTYQCPINSNSIECIDYNNIIVLQNNWVSIKLLNKNNSLLFIKSGTCPYGYCCNNNNGCNKFNKLFHIKNEFKFLNNNGIINNKYFYVIFVIVMFIDDWILFWLFLYYRSVEIDNEMQEIPTMVFVLLCFAIDFLINTFLLY